MTALVRWFGVWCGLTGVLAASCVLGIAVGAPGPAAAALALFFCGATAAIVVANRIVDREEMHERRHRTAARSTIRMAYVSADPLLGIDSSRLQREDAERIDRVLREMGISVPSKGGDA